MENLGRVLRVAGIVIMLFSYFILFLVIEPIIGMEAIVGKEYVIRQPDGNYVFSNPFAVWFWVGVIVLFGFVVNRIGWALIKSQFKV